LAEPGVQEPIGFGGGGHPSFGKQGGHHRAARQGFAEATQTFGVRFREFPFPVHDRGLYRNGTTGDKEKTFEKGRYMVILNPMCNRHRGLLRSEDRYFRVERREIAYVKFILEAYEGIGTLTTIQPADGLIRIQIPPGCGDVAEAIVRDLRKSLRIRPVAPPKPSDLPR
jgi:hypothetical protein